jgi:hypothetical protein
MDDVIANYVMSLVFTFSTIYFIIIAIEEMRVLKHYIYDSSIKDDWGLLLLGADTICKIIIYLCVAYMIVWIYLYSNVTFPFNGGSFIDMV